MKTILFLTLLLALHLPIMAGSADAVIRGKTESGRTEVEVHVGDIDGLIRFAKLTIDGKSYALKEEQIAFQTVVRDQKNGLYFLTFQGDQKEFRLWMIPNTEKVTEQGDGVYRSRFAAILEATDPRESDRSFAPRITIGCTLDYEI